MTRDQMVTPLPFVVIFYSVAFVSVLAYFSMNDTDNYSSTHKVSFLKSLV